MPKTQAEVQEEAHRMMHSIQSGIAARLNEQVGRGKERRHWKQQDAARACAISPAELRRCQNNEHGPRGMTLGVLCQLAVGLELRLMVSLLAPDYER